MSREHLIRCVSQLASDRVLVVPKKDAQNHYLFVFVSKEMNEKISLFEKGSLSLNDNKFVESFNRFLLQCPSDLQEILQQKPDLLTGATRFSTSCELGQLLCFLKDLAPENNTVSSKIEFPKVTDSLRSLTALIKELNTFSVVKDTFGMKTIDVRNNQIARRNVSKKILAHFVKERRANIDIIIPICSWDHCAYLLLRRWNDMKFIAAICDGGAGRDVFFENTAGQIPLVNGKADIYYHCVYVFQKHPKTIFKNSLRLFLRVIGRYWRHREIYRELWKCVTALCAEDGNVFRLKGPTLYEGKSPYFLHQELFVVLQNIGNCAIHNLLLALRLCAGLYGVDRNRSRHEYNKLTFLLYYASYVAWIKAESENEKFLLHHSGDPQKGQLLLDSTYKPILLFMRKKFLKCGGSSRVLPQPFRFDYTVWRDGVETCGVDIDRGLQSTSWVTGNSFEVSILLSCPCPTRENMTNQRRFI